MKMKVTAQQLFAIGYTQGKAMGVALSIAANQLTHLSAEDQLQLLAQVIKDPAAYENDAVLLPLVKEFTKPVNPVLELKTQALPYSIYGAEAIEQGALRQMETAMKLPVTVAGALMPDAHQGYGLPIGGVLATRNAVIPYGVGVDIGCRMCMTIYPLPTSLIEDQRERLKKMLVDNTQFGQATFKKPKDHVIFERSEFKELNIVRSFKDRAWKQIGSSGGGNHFVEFGVVDISNTINEYNLAPGSYLAVLSHSGSRGLGANIARHYTDLAMELCKLPQEAKHLAWLDLATEAG
ncbi:MAG: RtcB family protein, partial [Cyclobacteriaceae bacterium]